MGKREAAAKEAGRRGAATVGRGKEVRAGRVEEGPECSKKNWGGGRPRPRHPPLPRLYFAERFLPRFSNFSIPLFGCAG